MNIGDKIIVVRDIYQPPDECHPGGVLARAGETLIIRGTGKSFPFYVSHEGVERSSFGIQWDEFYQAPQNNDRLCYHVKVDSWAKVAKALREFKKKRHVKEGFYPDVQDLGGEIYEIRIFKSGV